MTATWRPQQAVRAVAIGIIRRGDELLLVAVRDDAGAIKGWRPLRGSTEFGDRSWPTARRSSNLYNLRRVYVRTRSDAAIIAAIVVDLETDDGSASARSLQLRHNAGNTSFGHMNPKPGHIVGPAAPNSLGSILVHRAELVSGPAREESGMTTMLVGGSRGRLRRGLADFVMAMVLFWTVALAASGSHNAYAVPLPAIGQEEIFAGAVPLSRASVHATASSQAGNGFHRQRELVLLSLAFSAIAAFNLAFLRHLRRVYASPRRGVWRRD